jgi:hypothetical protein
MTQEEINAKFTYTPPTPEQVKAIEDVFLAGKILAETIQKHMPAANAGNSWIVDSVLNLANNAREAILYEQPADVK